MSSRGFVLDIFILFFGEGLVNGTGFRAIERQTGVNHNTIIQWVKKAAKPLLSAPQHSEIPEVTQVDELETFVRKKKQKIWLWTAVNKSSPGILAWVLGDRSAKTFQKLWRIISCWNSYFDVTRGFAVYPCFIDDGDHIVKKTSSDKSRRREYKIKTLPSTPPS